MEILENITVSYITLKHLPLPVGVHPVLAVGNVEGKPPCS